MLTLQDTHSTVNQQMQTTNVTPQHEGRNMSIISNPMSESTRNASIRSHFAPALAVLIFGLGATVASAATLDVCASGCTYDSIQDAVDAASAGDVIELDPETFNEGGIDVDLNLTIRASSGQATVDGGSEDYAFKVLSGKIVDFEDLRLKGGTDCRLDNSGSTDLSTVYVLGTGSGNPSTFGGIINRASGSLTVADSSLISGNASTAYGGGITNYGDLVIVGSTVSANTGKFGGGFLNSLGIVSVMSSSFSANSATNKGGAWANLDDGVGPDYDYGSVAFHGSASTSVNTATVDCDKYWDEGGSPDCVD